MKKILLFVAVFFTANLSMAQTVADFESLSLATDSFWNGSDLSGGFTNGNAFFANHFDTTYSTWEGFAYSNMTDTLTAGYLNMYSAIAGGGYNASDNYALAGAFGYYGPTNIKLTGNAEGKTVDGFYITNNTYAYLSMRDGDAVAKQFGGSSGNDTDWFKVRVSGYLKGNSTSFVDFYLADYRFSDNSQDYIINDWTWLDLTSLGDVDSLTFELSSTDNGSWGMNTPAYFCMDNFTTLEGVGYEDISQNDLVSIYPNPSSGIVNIEVENRNSQLKIFDINGKIIKEFEIENKTKLDLQGLEKGIYVIQLQSGDKIHTKKLILN